MRHTKIVMSTTATAAPLTTRTHQHYRKSGTHWKFHTTLPNHTRVLRHFCLHYAVKIAYSPFSGIGVGRNGILESGTSRRKSILRTGILISCLFKSHGTVMNCTIPNSFDEIKLHWSQINSTNNFLFWTSLEEMSFFNFFALNNSKWTLVRQGIWITK